MNASTVAAVRREVPPILDDMVQIIDPTVRVADYALPSTNKIVRVTVKALRGQMAALMANHGAVCLGRNLDEAFVVCREVYHGLPKAYRLANHRVAISWLSTGLEGALMCIEGASG